MPTSGRTDDTEVQHRRDLNASCDEVPSSGAPSRMNGTLLRGIVLCLLVAGCTPLSCSEAPIVNQFGAYPETPGYLETASGERFPVYRVKYWQFDNGDPPALQLEYAPPVNVSDTAAVRAYAHAVWPACRPYVDAAGTRGAIITATNLERTRRGLARTARLRHFGILADKDSLGRWVLDGETQPLPPADAAHTGIFRPDGSRVPPAAFSGMRERSW
jgi:hypothetical protein